ncbi:MAG: hypothetical protein R3F60_15480 [bacterium]
MNVATCEARKVQAMEAWRRGDLALASAAWGELTAEYERHHFVDGLLALRFNHLLVALEAGDRPRIDALMASLGSQFLQIGDPSPLAADVARRICRLFAEPVAGVDHQATAALVALAADRIGGQVEVPRLAGSGAPFPSATTLEGLEAPDAALIILRQAARRPDADEPVWLDAVRRAFGPTQPLSPEASRVTEEAAQAIEADDLLHGYPLLVDAFEWALQNDAALAAEWSLGLAGMEAEGLPERLSFVPSLPEDRRLRTTLALHHRLAAALSTDAGAEGVALAQWRHVAEVGQRWLDLTRERSSRGGGRAEDVMREAEVGLLLAEALVALHDLATAEEVLSASVARARRDAFDHRTVSSQILRAQADVMERAGDDAEATWAAAVEAALPGVDAASGIRRLARVVDVVLTEGVVDRARLGVEALAGLARTGAGELASARLGRARALLAMLRPALAPDEAARTAMVVDLSAARLGDRAAAERALEAAHVVGDRTALALAALHRGWQAWLEADGAGERAAAIELVGDAAAEAQRAAAGAVRRGAEAAAAAVHRGPPRGRSGPGGRAPAPRRRGH